MAITKIRRGSHPVSIRFLVDARLPWTAVLKPPRMLIIKPPPPSGSLPPPREGRRALRAARFLAALSFGDRFAMWPVLVEREDLCSKSYVKRDLWLKRERGSSTSGNQSEAGSRVDEDVSTSEQLHAQCHQADEVASALDPPIT